MSLPLLQPTPRPLLTSPSFLKYRSPPLTTPSSTPVPYNGETPSPPDSPSSAAATVATSTRSDASSPFDSSPPTPRATSPDFALRSAAPSATPNDRISQASQPAFIRYVPPQRRPPPAWPPSQPRPVPFSFTQGLAAKLERFVVLSHVANRTQQNVNAPPAVIRQVHVSGGYKWIEPPTGVKGPTIAVPGAPDIWIGRGRTSERIKHDADLPGNNQYPDYNGECMPQGYDPLDLVFNSLKSPAELRGIQILTGRNNLKKLFSFCCGGRRFREFRLDARVIPGSKLVMLSRWELPVARRAREPTSWHLSFHEQNTERLFWGPDRTPGYHRILRYHFGGLAMMVKSDVSAALPWEGCYTGCHTSGPSSATSDNHGDGAGSEGDVRKDESLGMGSEDDLDDHMSLDSFSFYATPQSDAPSTFAPPRTLSSGVTVISTPYPHPPQGHLISLKTRQTFRREPRGIRHFPQADEAFSMVFFGQIGSLYLAHHRGGEFEEDMLEYQLGRGVLADMEKGYAGVLTKVRDMLSWVYECTLRRGSVGIVFSGGEVQCFGKKAGEVEGRLSAESWEVLRESGVLGSI